MVLVKMLMKIGHPMKEEAFVMTMPLISPLPERSFPGRISLPECKRSSAQISAPRQRHFIPKGCL